MAIAHHSQPYFSSLSDTGPGRQLTVLILTPQSVEVRFPLQLVKLGYLNYRPVTLVTDTSAS